MVSDRCFTGSCTKFGLAKISYGTFQTRLSIPFWVIDGKLAIIIHQANNFLPHHFPIHDGWTAPWMRRRCWLNRCSDDPG